jgi:hypothetical protein
MSVNVTTFANALKIAYGPMMPEQINIGSTPLAQKIEQTEMNIVGSTVKKAAPYGVNGGFGSISETSLLPAPGGNKYVQFESDLKNLAGVIHLTEKVILASQSDKAAFVNALTSETEGLKRAAKRSYGRQFYLDGTGNLTACGAMSSASTTVPVANAQYLVEGMIIDIVATANGTPITNGTGRRIIAVNKGATPSIVLEGTDKVTTTADHCITEQKSYNNEMTGLAKIFAQSGSIYGLDKATYPWLKAYVNSSAGALSDKLIIDTILDRENETGCKIDMIMVHPLVYTAYYDYIESTKSHVNTLELKGGFTALSVNGRPMAQDRFMPAATMDLLDTSVFNVHQFRDWDWMDQDGAILKWDSGYAAYKAVLTKYCELMCNMPGAQARLSGITVS